MHVCIYYIYVYTCICVHVYLFMRVCMYARMHPVPLFTHMFLSLSRTVSTELGLYLSSISPPLSLLLYLSPHHPPSRLAYTHTHTTSDAGHTRIHTNTHIHSIFLTNTHLHSLFLTHRPYLLRLHTPSQRLTRAQGRERQARQVGG